MSKALTIAIPGEPYAQKRARATRVGQHARVYDPKENRDWKATAQAHMAEAMNGRDLIAGPIRLNVDALFSMPRSRWLKTSIRPGEWHTKKPDADNVLKAVKDAASGVIWCDDKQVFDVRVIKWTAPQGEAPGLLITVEEVRDE